ncbi:MAG: CBS domain-containing protein [Cyclobacteriaceae bacterium]|nr:CBS domain-containing protein [Cyclobacteriaceae bacterium]
MNFRPNFEKKETHDDRIKDASKYEPVTNYMATDLIVFTPDTEIVEVIETLLEKRISGAPVLNENKEIVGLIDDKDCLRVLIDSVYHNQPISDSKVSSYMTDVLKTITFEADVVDVANVFLNSKYKRLLVVDDKGRLVGQVSRRDILRAIKSMHSANWKSQS